MDLAVGARQVIAMCEHTDSAGRPKLVGACSFEITAPGCVDTVVTDLALLRRASGSGGSGSGGSGSGFRLEEIARGFSVDEVLALTPMPVSVGDRVGIMQEGWGD
jgi:3-oxoacid CoA-transferase